MMLNDETAPPLSDTLLAEIRERLARYEHTNDTTNWYPGYVVTGSYVHDVPLLLFEIERLRGEVTLCVELLNLEG